MFTLVLLAPVQHMIKLIIPEEAVSDLITKGEDYKLNYATAVLGMGLLARNFHDSSKQSDGDRLIRCWKFFLLHFKVDGRVKYAVEAINLLAQVNGLLPPGMGHQLIWNRTCNLNGGAGHNDPIRPTNGALQPSFQREYQHF